MNKMSNEDLIIDLIGILIMLILTFLNIALAQSNKKLSWFFNAMFIIFIPLLVIDINNEMYFDFTPTLLYLLLIINFYMNIMKIRYLLSDNREGIENE